MERFFKKLFPKKSPLDLIKEHSEICKFVASKLKPAILEYFKGHDLNTYEREVDRAEHRSDEIKKDIKEIYVKLKWSFFDKTEVYKLISDQEKIVDIIDDFLKILMMNQVENVPEDVKEGILNLVVEVEKTVDEMVEAVEDLEKVVESGFSPIELRKEEKLTEEVEKEESKTDEIGKKLGRRIFSLKKEMNAVDVIFLSRIVIMLLQIADLAENAAERIRTLIM